MNEPIVELTGDSLTISDMVIIVRDNKPINISKEAIMRINKASEIVQDILKEKRRVYGVTTGFGYLQNTPVSPEDAQKLQNNLIISHAAGVGPEFSRDVVRGMMLLQLNKFARGHSGVRFEVVSLLLDLLNKDIIPVVPSQGSLGASGDLAPLAHLSLVLIGKGYAHYGGIQISGLEALEKAGLLPVELTAKEGLALLNGTQAMTSIAAIAVADAEYLVKIANLATSMSMEVHRANIDALNPKIHQVRPHEGQIDTAGAIREYLKGSKLVRENIAFQDSYSLRCAPVVHGATLDTIRYVKRIVKTEMNSSTDNPLIFTSNTILSGGNFHGQPIALVMDFLGIAVAELGNISERRIERLLNPTLSGLPAFLSLESGLNSGFMVAQYTAASLVSENKQLASPSSVDSIPVSANQEDHVSMGTIAALHTQRIIEHVQFILAIELLCVSQAIDVAEIQDKLAHTTLEVYQKIRKVIPMLHEDRELSPDINTCVELIRNRRL
ncbi:MAG: histidine ammonia-lyase [Candidatus Heimdallarchaeota archaeon]|nr:MAG: histidine ammonia-lyase [Candidatus Heimdallarchaeota archaeon]